MNYKNFICYRGTSSAGQQIGQDLYDLLSRQTQIFGNTYFAPCSDDGEKRNFLLDPEKIMRNIKNFIILLTKNFFNEFIIDGEKNSNSVTCMELEEVLKNPNVNIITVNFPDFNWYDSNTAIPNSEILVKIYGRNNAARIMGVPPIPYVELYKDRVFAEISTKMLKIATKAVVFDFDGTLTKVRANIANTWESIWIALGYSINDCEYYHKKFSNDEITHTEWCEITEKCFKDKNMTFDTLINLAKDVQLIDDVDEVIKLLHSKGIYLYILSGSIKSFIELVLGKDTIKYFTDIKANRLSFDENGQLETITPTPYDFEDKARFVARVIEEKNLKPSNVLFVGNSFNDEFVYTTGVDTLCINPMMTDYYDNKVWHNYIRNVTSLKQIMPYIKE